MRTIATAFLFVCALASSARANYSTHGQLQVKPKNCNWVAGDYLAQIIVSTKTTNGQAAAKLSVE